MGRVSIQPSGRPECSSWERGAASLVENLVSGAVREFISSIRKATGSA